MAGPFHLTNEIDTTGFGDTGMQMGDLDSDGELEMVFFQARDCHIPRMSAGGYRHEKQVHCNYNNKPVNYEQNAPFALTQQLKPVQTFVYSIMMWRSNVFLDQFTQKGFAMLCGKFGRYPVSKLSTHIIKNDEDLIFAEQLIKKLKTKQTIQYDSIVDSNISVVSIYS